MCHFYNKFLYDKLQNDVFLLGIPCFTVNTHWNKGEKSRKLHLYISGATYTVKADKREVTMNPTQFIILLDYKCGSLNSRSHKSKLQTKKTLTPS
jgi:hypothetical protein